MAIEIPRSRHKVAPMKKGEMRVVGTLKASWIERFNRIQARAALFRPAIPRPKGVQKFRTWEEFDRATQPWLTK